jgi:hypothetical protein
MNDTIAITKIQLLCLIQVLEMDVKHNADGCLGIATKQALLNMKIITPKQRPTKARKLEMLKALREAYESDKPETTATVLPCGCTEGNVERGMGHYSDCPTRKAQSC